MVTKQDKNNPKAFCRYRYKYRKLTSKIGPLKIVHKKMRYILSPTSSRTSIPF